MASDRFVIKHLYFFDDLSYHIDRAVIGRGGSKAESMSIVGKVWDKLDIVFGCLDHSVQDHVLIHWDHACAALAFVLNQSNQSFDVNISQGCNGEFALLSLNDTYLKRYGSQTSTVDYNVRIAHILDDSADPFYSDFSLGVSKGPSLELQLDETADRILKEFKGIRRKLKISIFDDCIQTGRGSQTVAEGISSRLEGKMPFEMHMTCFIGNEATMHKFNRMGWKTWVGTLYRGESYPTSWDWDIYFLKDQILDNAIRYKGGNSQAYIDAPWLDKVFGKDYKVAVEAFGEIRSELEAEGILDLLEKM